jgi:hypothetical protein
LRPLEPFATVAATEVRAAKSGASIDGFIGCQYRPVIKPLAIEEIAEIAAEGSTGRH